MLNTILSAEEGSNNYFIFILLGLFFVLMIIMPMFQNKKRQKSVQDMRNSIKVGTKVMTIGGFVGVVAEVDDENNQYTIDVGVEGTPVFVRIDKLGIHSNLDAKAASAAAKTQGGSSDDTKSNGEQRDVFGDKEEQQERSIDE